MGTYNTIFVELECPKCHKKSDFDVQFKHGDCWLYEYELGDKITWGGNDYGTPEHKKVIAEGITGPCLLCGKKFIYCNVLIEDDVIISVTLKRG